MHHKVITIARTLGAGGEDLGNRVADELGYRYVDDEIIDRAAALGGVNAAEVAAAEARPGLRRRLSGLFGAKNAPPKGSPGPRAAGHTYEQLIVETVRETAAMEFVVIVAHGAGIALANSQGALRVLVTASAENRAARLAAEKGITQDRARDEVDDSDKSRADFLKRFYGLDEEAETNYDLVINTDQVEVDRAAAAIVALA